MLGGVAAGAAVGIGGVASAGASPPVQGEDQSSLTLTAEGLRLGSGGAAHHQVGDSLLISGDITDDHGTEGVMHGEYRCIAAASMVGTGAPTSLETHHFVLADGTITGSGVASLDETPDDFTITGGTGAYHGASGSYTATQDHLGLGGNGTASYIFTLTTPITNKSEGSN